MLVYVTTSRQLQQAFDHWLAETGSDERQVIKNVFDQFLAAPEAEIFHTVTGLVCFNVPEWQQQFDRWRDGEITRDPHNLETIRYWTLQVSDLIQSDWGVRHKLIVKECLQQSDDFSGSHAPPDLFDALIASR
ncbi:MAG: hypothetical protein HOM14_03860 [Gammaproteobacteria bacterium]|jgi:hypothetical protein|nr:hypothetical protein [Gammaproteobacteria bacterium]MBT6550471.1 hypothetical protein [Gammaproteobacteria bacterium]MBT7043833.1 hypothetical protein [Gammaproteobacteria bacterium]